MEIQRNNPQDDYYGYSSIEAFMKLMGHHDKDSVYDIEAKEKAEKAWSNFPAEIKLFNLLSFGFKIFKE